MSVGFAKSDTRKNDSHKIALMHVEQKFQELLLYNSRIKCIIFMKALDNKRQNNVKHV